MSSDATPPSSLPAPFVARLRHLKELHAGRNAHAPTPPMWGLVQFGALVMGGIMGYNAVQALGEAPGGFNWMALVVFGGITLVMACLPEVFLRLVRKNQADEARRQLEEFIRITVRNFPQEVEQCGGVEVLCDPLEMEALIHVVNTTQPPGDQPKPG